MDSVTTRMAEMVAPLAPRDAPARVRAPMKVAASADTMAQGGMRGDDRPEEVPRPRRKATPQADQIPKLEAAAQRAIVEVQKARRGRSFPSATLSPIELARQDILASLAEIRNAMIPPTLTTLDQRR